MNTYRVEYQSKGAWTPGMLVKMSARHVRYYLQFLAGERPMVSYRGTLVAKMYRKEKRALPARMKRCNPDWATEDGFYVFDGEQLEYQDLTQTRAR